MGVYSKEDGKKISEDTSDVLTLEPLQDGEFHGMPVVKGAEEDKTPTDNVIYFNSDAERDNHLLELAANTAKGINRYTGFESMYADINTNEPITYLVGNNLMSINNSGAIENAASYPFFNPTAQN